MKCPVCNEGIIGYIKGEKQRVECLNYKCQFQPSSLFLLEYIWKIDKDPVSEGTEEILEGNNDD